MKAKKEPQVVVVRMEPIAVDIREAARLLNIGLTYMNKLIKNGELESFTLGRRRKVTVSSLRDLVAKRVAESSPPKREKEAALLRPHEIPEWMEP